MITACDYALQMFTGHYGVSACFPCTEKPYTPQRERLCMLWGNPLISTDCGKNPMITIGFPRNEWPLACISNKGEKLMLKHFCEKEDEKKLIIFCDFALIRNTPTALRNISPLLKHNGLFV